MLMKKPHIKLFRTNTGEYLFDINTNNIIGINEPIYNYFENYLQNEDKNNLVYNNLDIKDKNAIEDMTEKGLLKDIKDIEIDHSMSSHLEKILNNELYNLCLQVTQNCNLRCEYCVYSGSYKNRMHSNKRMHWETAKKAIDFLAVHSGSGEEEILIGFYGGEPLIEFELIKKCVTYSYIRFKNRKIRFNITTNATMLQKEKIKFLLDNKFTITISLDGPQEIQDSHRVKTDGSGSYGNVISNIMEMANNHQNFSHERILFNAVLSDDVDWEKVIYFFKNNLLVKQFFCQFSTVNKNNLVENKQENTERNRETREYEIFKAFLFGIGRIDDKMTSQLGFAYANSVADNFYNRSIGEKMYEKAHPGGPCIPGQRKLFCDAEGNLFPCERVSESSGIMKIGDIWNGFNVDAANKILNVAKVTENECKKCWGFDFCSQCVAFADGGEEISMKKRLNECIHVKNGLEDMIKDYVVLKKLGCEFEKFLSIKV